MFAFMVIPFLLISALAPRCETIFQNFGVAGSTLTRLILGTSHTIASPLALPVIVLGAAALCAAVKVAAPRRPWIGTAAFLLAAAFCVVALALLIAGLFLPTLQMVESIQLPKRP